MQVVSLLEKEFGRTAIKEMLPMQRGDVQATYADIDDLAREIGFRPATTIEHGIAKFAKWYRDYHNLWQQGAMSNRIIPLIMCGGAGTRLWPSSREGRPKQFLPLFGVRSTFQDTLLRVSDAALFERPIVITNTAYRFHVLDHLASLGLQAH